jgi:TP901 family phage tail tape measure protein
MAKGFNLTAEINLRGPANIRTVVADIRRQLGTVSANVNVKVNPASSRNIAGLNQALTNLNNTLSQTNVLATQVTASLNALATAGGTASASLGGLPRSMGSATASLNRFNASAANTGNALRVSRTEFEEFGRQAALAVRRFAAFSTVTSVVFKVTNAISSAYTEFVAFDKELVRVAQVTDSSLSSLSGLERSITNLSTSLGVSSQDLIKVSSTLAQAGLSAKDTEKSLKALALSALAPSFEGLNDTVEGSIALMRQFGIQAGDLEKSLGSINAVSARFAVEAGDIIAAIQRTGGVFAAASRGVSEGKDALNEFIAVFTSIRATTRESAETIATGLRTIFTRIQRSSTIEALKEYGVNLTDIEGKFVGAYKAVELLSGGLGKLDPRDLKFSKIIEELGGFRQIGKVIPLIQEFATAQQALAVAQKGQGSLSTDAATAQQALAIKISKVREEFVALIRSVSKSDSFQNFINLSLDLASSLIKLSDSAKVLLPALTAIAAIRGASFITQFSRGFAGGIRTQRNNSGGPIRGFATGGLVPGRGDTDTYPAMLTPGEFVIRKKAVDKIGVTNLHRINRASGGYISQAKSQSSEPKQYFDGARSQRTVQKSQKTKNSGRYIAPKVSTPERAHIGGDLYIDQSSLVRYLERYSASKLKRSIGEFSGTKPGMAVDVIGGMSKTEYDKFIKEKLNLSVKKRIRLNFPRTFNQALRATDPGLVLKNDLVDIVSSAPDLTDPLGGLSSSEINKIKQNSIRKIRSLKALPASSYRKNLGWRSGTPDSLKTAPAFDSDYQLNPLAQIIESSVNETTKQKLQNDIDLLFRSSKKDAKYISSKTGQERTRTQSRESARLSTIMKKYSDNPRNVQRRDESYYDRALENAISSLPEKRRRKKPQTGTSDYSKDRIPVYMLSAGGSVQRFADGGVTTRNIGYIDSDVLNDPANKALVDEQIEKLKKQGIKIEGGYRGYKQYLSDLAAKARQEKQIGRLTSIVGLPGAGKSTMMMGSSQADNATMRKTTRFPILTPEDIARSSSVIDVTASINPKKIDASLQASDRIVSLSSSTKEEQQELRRRRKLRNRQIESGTSATGFGRRAGTTDSAPVDSGYIEAILQSEIKDPKKIRTLGVTPKGFRTKRGDDIPEVLKEKINLYYGNFGPTTAGHVAAQQQGMQESAKRGISRSIVAVGIDTPVKSGDEHSTRSALLSQKERIALAKKAFPESSITAATKETFGFGLPSLYEIEKSGTGRRRFVKPSAGSTATVGDEKGSSSLQKYLDAGFDPKDILTLERLGGISGTKVREALLKGDTKTLKKLTSPAVFDILSRNSEVFQRRSSILPKIMERIDTRATSSLSAIEAELAKYPGRLTPKIKAEHPEYEEIVANLRKQRDKIKSKAESRSGSTMRRLSRMFPSAYGIDIGDTQKFMAGEAVKARAGRKKAERLHDTDIGEARTKTASEIISELTIMGAQQALTQAGGAGVNPNTLLRKLKLNPDEVRLKDSILSAYVTKVNAKTKEARERDLGATTSAQQAKTLFGAVGMFGSSFPAENVTIENGLKEPKTVRVFGQVLDRNRAAKQLRLSKVAQNSEEYTGIANAPTANQLNKAYTKEEMSGVRKRNNDRIIKAILSELSGGSGTKAFFDFDKTLAFGADKIGSKSARKRLDYGAFGDPAQVEAALRKAKPSQLLLGLRRLIKKVQKNIPDQFSTLLDNMYVVSARPASTMGLISKWLMSKGLPIPSSNVRGVGGAGLSDKAVAINKAETIASLAGTSKGVFIDDNLENINAATGLKNISSYQYGMKADNDRATRKAIADSQGGKFQNDLNVELKRTAPALYQAMAKEPETHRSIDFPYGIGPKIANDWFGNPLLATSPVDAKRTLTGPRGKLLSNITNYLKTKGFAIGGHVPQNNEDSVPALLTPGEFVINKKAAQRIGAAKLHQLNRADRIKGFNKGGAVGPQRFFLGGGASARPGDSASINNLMVPASSINQLRLIIDALEELGVSASKSADLLKKGGRASIQAAHAAYEADIVRLRIAGAPIQTVINAETQLANMRQQATRQVAAQRQLSGVGGSKLQRIDTAAQNNIQRMVQRAQNAGVNLDENQMRRIEDLGYRRAATRARISPTQMAGLNGNDLRQFINSAMGDPKTFEQMNKTFETQRKQEILRQINIERGVTNDKKEIANRSKEARMLAKEESDARRQILNQTRGSSGPGSARSQRFNQAMFGASFVLPMVGQMMGGDPSNAGSSAQAGQIAGAQGAVNMASTGAMVTSMAATGPIGIALGAAATAVATFGQATMDAHNAVIDFEKQLVTKKVEHAIADINKMFEKLAKDLSNVDIQNSITKKLNEATSILIDNMEFQRRTAKIYWTNIIDMMANNNNASNERSRILEKYGTGAYLNSTAFGQNPVGMTLNAIAFGIPDAIYKAFNDKSMFAGSEEKANQNRYEYTKMMIPDQARESARGFTDLADTATRLIEEKIRSGMNVDDIINNPDFEKYGRNLALANSSVQEQILTLRNSILVADDEKKAREESIIKTYAEEEARRRASIVAREIEIREAKKSSAKMSRSLERMFQNMEQAINRTNFGLQRMADELDLVTSSLTGQAKAGEGVLKSINVLQNPRAYSSRDFSEASNQAASFFGDNSGLMNGLLTLGNDIETTIMGTISRTLSENEGDNQEKISVAIERAVKTKLADLALPEDVSDKLAREVKRALDQLRKEGDQKIDFSQLEERLQDISKVFDSAKRAQEIAIKALENWNSALNTYAESMNKIVELQISYQARARKSTELQTNAQLELAKVLGRDVSVSDIKEKRNSQIRQQTGGLTSPDSIAKNFANLEEKRRQQEAAIDVARNQGARGAEDFQKMQNNLAKTNVALRENYDALKNLAENSDVAAAALNKVQEAQQKQQGKVSFIEKLVTSTPDEYDALNRAVIRLQRNMNGQMNSINNSVGAQKAYAEALNEGASAAEAMRAAQAAFANERKDTLSALNDLLPFLGNGQQANQIRANTLQSMLKESGLGVSPLMQQILDSLRNPELDPETQKAIQLYEDANQLQIAANNSLVKIEQALADATADKAAKAIASALEKTILTFKTAEQQDINNGVAQGRAFGGIIYASEGMFTPRGTDTVPAMLTPGEFVVNKAATAKNLGLLQNINNNHYSTGGKVNYYAAGGYVSSIQKENKRTEENFKETQDKFLDLDDPGLREVLSGSEGSKIYQIPGRFIKIKEDALAQTPDRDAYNDGAMAIPRWDLSKIFDAHQDGNVVPGYSMGMQMKRNSTLLYGVIDWPLIYPIPGVTNTEPVEIGNGSFIGGLTEDKRISLATKPYIVSDEKKYLEQLQRLKITPEFIKKKFAWISNAAHPVRQAIDGDILDYPTDVTPQRNEPRGIVPYQAMRNSMLYSTDTGTELSAQNKIYARIYQNPEKKMNRAVGAGATNVPTFETGGPFEPTHDGYFNMEARTFDIDKKKVIPSADAQKIGKYNQDLYQILVKTYKALVPGAGQPRLSDLPLSDSGGKIGVFDSFQKQLANLYNGITPYENFIGETLDILDIDESAKAKNFTVISAEAATQQMVQDYIEKQVKNKGGKQPFSGGNPISIGIAGAPPGLDWVTEDLFDIKELATGNTKEFPVLINILPSEISEEFEKRAAEATKGSSPIKTSLFNHNGELSLDLAGGKKAKFPYFSTYTKYTGPLWDTATNTYSDKNKIKDFFLANPLDGNTPANIFKGLDISNNRLFDKTKPIDFDDRGNVSLSYDQAKLTELIDLYRVDKDKREADKIDAASMALKAASIRFKLNKDVGPLGALIKADTKVGDNDIFSGFTDQADKSMSIGDFLIEAAQKYAEQTTEEAKTATGEVADSKFNKEGFADQKKPFLDTLKGLTLGSLRIFGRRPLPGFPQAWFYALGGGRAYSLLKNNRMTLPIGKNIATYLTGMLAMNSGPGAQASTLASMSTNLRAFNYFEDLRTLIQGAFLAYQQLSQSDTSSIVQLLKNSRDAFGNLDLSTDAVEDIFRSLGAMQSFNAAGSQALGGDYQRNLANQLAGSKIRVVKQSGKIEDVDAANIPYKNYTDLMALALNPYNEYTSKDIRSGIFDKLTQDISTATNQYGGPMFSQKTRAFLLNNLSTLKDWYAGNGNWLGQDYLFDKVANPDSKDRGDKFKQNLAIGNNLWSEANIAHRNLGAAVKFGGDLPHEEWFTKRIEAGNFATGGMVYAQDGSLINFTPRGTDTVPAMLTPGEFVVNRAATAKNLPLLKQINGNRGYSRGGVVNYLQDGGQAEGAPEFDLGTTTEYRPENSFGNRSISTLSRIQYESRYGVPGVRDNVKMISEEIYKTLRDRSAQESTLRQAGTPIFYDDNSTRSKRQQANKLKLNKKEYTELSIAETERRIPLFQRQTEEYYPNGTNFDHSVFDRKMLDFQGLPTINYLNADIRSHGQKIAAMKDAVGAKENGFPDLLAKYLLGMKDYESTWASVGLSFALDLQNIMPEPLSGGAGQALIGKGLSWLGKNTGLKKAITIAMQKGKSALSSLDKIAFRQVENGIDEIPIKDLGLADLLDSKTAQSLSPSPTKIPRGGERISFDDKALQMFFRSVPTNVKDFKKSFWQTVSSKGIFQQVSDFTRFIGLPDNEALLGVPVAIDIKHLEPGIRGRFDSNLARLSTQGVSGAASTGRGLASVQPYAEVNTLYHELVHQFLNGIRTRHPKAWEFYQERVRDMFTDHRSWNNLANAFDAIGGSYRSEDVLYGASYKLRDLQKILGQHPGDKDLRRLVSRATKHKDAGRASWASIDEEVTDVLRSKRGSQYLETMQNNGLEEFLTVVVQNAGQLDKQMRQALDTTLEAIFHNSGIARDRGLFDNFYAELDKPTIFQRIKTAISARLSRPKAATRVPKPPRPQKPKTKNTPDNDMIAGRIGPKKSKTKSKNKKKKRRWPWIIPIPIFGLGAAGVYEATKQPSAPLLEEGEGLGGEFIGGGEGGGMMPEITSPNPAREGAMGAAAAQPGANGGRNGVGPSFPNEARNNAQAAAQEEKARKSGWKKSKKEKPSSSPLPESSDFPEAIPFSPLEDTNEETSSNLLNRPGEPLRRAKGGIVYASNGSLINFQPRGTDTVPAMLTPGEFVVNKAATQKNLPALQEINSNTYMADGGLLGRPKVVQGVTLNPRDKLTPRFNNIDSAISTSNKNLNTVLQNENSQNNKLNELLIDSKNNKKVLSQINTKTDFTNSKINDIARNTGSLTDKINTFWQMLSGPSMEMPPRVINRSMGGIIYASEGTLVPYSPKGTDTVPAMLTPGEFVVNKAATSKNLNLLKNINNGYSQGGIIYADDGMKVPGTGDFTTTVSGASTNNIQSSQTLSDKEIELERLRQSFEQARARFEREKEQRDRIQYSLALVNEGLSKYKNQRGAALDRLLGISNPSNILNDEKSSLQRKLTFNLLGVDNDVGAWIARAELLSKQLAETGVGITGATVAGSAGAVAGGGVASPVTSAALGTAGYIVSVSAYKDFLGEQYKERMDLLRQAFPGQSTVTDLAPAVMGVSSLAKNAYTNLGAIGIKQAGKEISSEVAGDAIGTISAAFATGEPISYSAQDAILASLGIKLSGPSRSISTTRSRASEQPTASSIKLSQQSPPLPSTLGSILSSYKKAISNKIDMLFNRSPVAVHDQALKYFKERGAVNFDEIREHLRGEVKSSKGVAVSVGMIAKMLGVEPKYLIAEDMRAVRKTIKDAGGYYSDFASRDAIKVDESTGLVARTFSREPGDIDPGAILALNNDNKINNSIIWHEIMHSMLTRMGKNGYERFIKLMQNNQKSVLGYITERPDLFRSYGITDIGDGAYYVGKALQDMPQWSFLKYVVETASDDDIKYAMAQKQAYLQKLSTEDPGRLSSPDIFDDVVPGTMLRVSHIAAIESVENHYGGIKNAIKYIESVIKSGRGVDPAYLAHAGDHNARMMDILSDLNIIETRSALDWTKEYGYEEFATQLLQNFDRLDPKGLSFLSDIISSVYDDNRIAALRDPKIVYAQLQKVFEGSGSNIEKQQYNGLETPALSSGGIIKSLYASTGKLVSYKPIGTDTVPAMLTPGEFVVNAQATAKNLPLLKSINEGNYKSSGGVVYLDDGGVADEKDLAAANGRNGFKRKMAVGATQRNKLQKIAAKPDDTGTLWVFLNPSPMMIDKELVASGFTALSLLKKDLTYTDVNEPLTTLDLGATIYSKRASSQAKALKHVNDRLNIKDKKDPKRIKKAITAGQALDRARREYQKQTIGNKVISELAYQMNVMPNEFEVLNDQAYEDPDDVNNHIQSIAEEIILWKDNDARKNRNGMKVAQEYGKYVNRNSDINVKNKNALQAMALMMSDKDLVTHDIRALNAKYPIFKGTDPIEILTTQTKAQKDERAKLEEIIDGLKNYAADAYVSDIINSPEFQSGAGILSSDAFAGVTVSNFSGGNFSNHVVTTKPIVRAAQFNKGGVVYADDGMLIPYQPKGTDTVPAMLTPGEFVINRAATQRNLPLLKAINSNTYANGGVVYAAKGLNPRQQEYYDARQARKEEYERMQAERRRAYQNKNNVNRFRDSQGNLLDQQTRRNILMGSNQQQNIGQSRNNINNVDQNMGQFSNNLQAINQLLQTFGSSINTVISQINRQITGSAEPRGVSNNKGTAPNLDGMGGFVAKFDEFINQLKGLNLPPVINLQVAPITLNITGGEALAKALEGPMSNQIKSEIAAAFQRLNDATEGAIQV